MELTLPKSAIRQYQQKIMTKLEVEECPHGICDGTGWTTEGILDDIRSHKCLCKIEKERDQEANS